VLGMKALHVKVSKPAVPHVWVALSSYNNTRVGTMSRIRWGAWVRLLLRKEQILSVAGRL
jgi:hypothetical protein